MKGQRRVRFTQSNWYARINETLSLKGVCRGVIIGSQQSILDVGCGQARELSCLAETAGLAVGVDIKRFETWMHHTNRIHFVVADAAYLPFKSCMFGFAFLKDVLHHVPRNCIKAVISEASRVTKERGILRIIEANRYHINPILVYEQDKSHEHFTRELLMQLVHHDEFYGYELLPSTSPSKIDFFWNLFVYFLVFLTTWAIGRRLLILYTKIKERFFKHMLTYYVLSKRALC